MYTSPDEDRSDLFLAAAVYVLGPELLSVILRRLPIPAAVSPVVSLLVIVLTTIAVPLWLMRYRKQPLSSIGFDGSTSTFGAGLLVSLPVAAAYVLYGVIAAGSPFTVVPVASAVTTGTYVETAISIIGGLCVAFLMIYTTVKARTAFRMDPAYIKPTMLRLARYTALAGAVAGVLLLLTIVVQGLAITDASEVVLAPAGVVGAGWLAYRAVRGSQLTSRAVLLTPMILLAIGSFVIFAQALEIVFGLWRAALLAGLGLVLGVLLENYRSAWAPVGFAVGLTMLTPLLR